MRGYQFKGKLTPKLASEGIRLAKENAFNLLQDSKLLFENERYQRSVTLSILAIEEQGKTNILRGILLEDDLKVLNKEWQNYRKHTSKNTMWIFQDLFDSGARKMEDYRTLFGSNMTHTKDLENIKQLSLYTDIYSKGVWSFPEKVIDKDLATEILESAKSLIRNDKLGIDSEKGLELWIKHMRPVWKKANLEEMKLAILNCYEEAEEKGIIEKGRTNDMKNFVK
ncbi:abortive infection protein, AbiV family [Gillisia sp. Hel1_33_143]|uniref:AbiV family abortive infection protein n=1 Tax=Gillisia sp. Hel1_33_143 TaxID=1336796 RepID=UPI00087B46F9|nr:AbiV family abortive infection protein [Gillisia sp. Hel1_33_143]SDS27330.1 abortive infection protein, AbiV family [Gillisia sp. Hel1_33_143]